MGALKEAAEIAADRPAARMLFTATEKSQLLHVKDGEIASCHNTRRARAEKGLEEERAGFPVKQADQCVLLDRLLLVGTSMEPACPLGSTLASLPANFTLCTAPWGCLEAAMYLVLDAPSKSGFYRYVQQLPWSLRVKYPALTLPSFCFVGCPTLCLERHSVVLRLPLQLRPGVEGKGLSSFASSPNRVAICCISHAWGLAGTHEGAEQGTAEDAVTSRKQRI